MLRGDPSKKGRPKNEPKPASGDIVPPDWVIGVALKKWQDVLPKLEAMRVVTPADVDAIARYCALYEQWVKYLEQMRRGLDVLVIRDDSGKVKYMQSSPAATMFLKIGAALLKIEQEYGLTPAARVGLEAIGGQETAEEAKLRAFIG